MTSIFSDVIVRDKHMKVLPPGKKGFIQLISILPKSYPGHIILTEDIGEIVENDCNCKNLGNIYIFNETRNLDRNLRKQFQDDCCLNHFRHDSTFDSYPYHHH